MPLIHCPECAGQVSTEAHACPHCGFPFPARAPRPVGTRPARSADRGVLAIVGVVVLAVVAVLAVSSRTEYPALGGGEHLADSLFADSLLTAIGEGGDGSESASAPPAGPADASRESQEN